MSNARPLMKSNVIVAALVGTVLAAASAAQAQQFRELVDAHRDVEYVKRTNPDWTGLMDIYLPKGAAATDDKPRPVVVWVHGGAWQMGNKNRCPALVLVPKGYAVVSINYRLSQVAPFPAQLHDCKAAIRFLRANAKKYNLDPKRIGVWGASAGGHLVSLLGTVAGDKALEADKTAPAHARQDSRVQAVCNFFGPTDMLKLITEPSRDDPNNPVARLLGGPVKDKIELAKKASPTTHATKDDAPHLFMHGDRDNLVPLEQSELLNDALKKLGVETSLHVVKGAGHGFGGAGVVRRVGAFFDEHLKETKTAE